MRDYGSRKIRNERLAFLKRLAGQKGKLKLIGYQLIRTAFWGALILITALLVNRLLDYLGQSSYLALRDIRFEGCQRVSPQELMTLANIKAGANILAIDLKYVSQQMKSNPWVKEITIRRSLCQGVSIEVVERKPTAVVVDKKLFLTDEDGIIFKEVDHGDPVDMPVITGLSLARGNLGAVKQAIDLLMAGHSAGILPYDSISEIHIEENQVFSLYTVQDSLCIRLGFDDYKNKLALLARVQEDLHKRRISPGTIHLLSADVAHVKKVSSS